MVTIDDMDCPNCGAPVDFAGGSRTTCAYCRSQLYLTDGEVKAESVLNDLLEDRSVTRSAATTPGVSDVNLDEIAELLLQNKKIEAIKLYREQTGLGLKEAKDAVEAIEATGQPTLPASQGKTAPRRNASTLGCLLGCLPILLFMGVCTAFIMLSSQIMFRAFGPLEQAMQIVNSDPAVTRALGKPLTLGAFVTGSISSSGSSSSARFSAPIFGSTRNGELRVSGNWRKGFWDLSVWVVYDADGEEQTIFITRKVK